MIQYKKLLMTLALLITAATGAWAQWTGRTYTATESEINWNSVNVTDDATLTINQGVEVMRGSITISAGKTLTVVGPGQLQVKGAITGSGTIIVKGNASLLVYGTDGAYGAPGFNGGDGGDGAAAIMCSITIYSGSIRAYGGAGGDGGEGDEEEGTGGDGGDGAPAFAGSGTLTYYGGSIEAFGGSAGNGGDGNHYGNGGAEAIAFADTYNVVFENQPTSIQDAYNNPIDINNIKGVWYFKILGDDAEPEPPLEVAWDAETNTGTFDMPGSDVVLTPRYAAATIYDADETEKQAYETLKEAIANVQDGDVIKLDWDVTLTENLKTPTIQNGAKFTVDFNGHTLDCGIYGISLTNSGDQLTFTDNSGEKDPGGLINTSLAAADNAKYIFDAGRYTLANNATAAEINECCESFDTHELAEGKEFVDLEGGPEENDGFTMIVAWKAFELTVGAGRFDTFFAAQNVVLVEGEDISFYTISSINDERTEAYVTLITSEVIPAGTPILVYNGGQAKQTVKLMVGPTNVINILLPTHAPEFMGTAVAKTFTEDDMAAADYYALSGGKLFVPVYDAGTIGKNQCWLEFDKSAGAPARLDIVFEESQATEVTEVIEVNEVSDDSWYDLSGRKLDGEPTEKGVYVKDGKKVVVK